LDFSKAESSNVEDAQKLLADAPKLLTAAVVAPFTFSGLAHPFLGSDTDLTGEGTVTIFMVRTTAGQFTGLFLDQAIFTLGQRRTE
jgi:hypothetical protein